ncbi:MAG: hypothetical protein AVDCRST_MAG91-154 [uncultured Sphingomonadaceae bacterium]|uniref:Uncharacterized protein n=1 Tax=uncultured Sphingomonadaceae bacterium TaxID=169976 RepID=A0A6J4RWU8_9SPHN|nr:MAG: hypothetical protein AVDCRST_MAG91-154 [uncultured Sphingomonadaceae bacterium]
MHARSTGFASARTWARAIWFLLLLPVLLLIEWMFSRSAVGEEPLVVDAVILLDICCCPLKV